jgi:hypothetical protein
MLRKPTIETSLTGKSFVTAHLRGPAFAGLSLRVMSRVEVDARVLPEADWVKPVRIKGGPGSLMSSSTIPRADSY